MWSLFGSIDLTALTDDEPQRPPQSRPQPSRFLAEHRNEIHRPAAPVPSRRQTALYCGLVAVAFTVALLVLLWAGAR